MGGGKQDCPHTENVIASKVALELSGNKISVYSAKPFPLLSLLLPRHFRLLYILSLTTGKISCLLTHAGLVATN